MTKYAQLRGRALLFLLCLWFLWFTNFSVRMVFSPILPLIEDEFAVSHAQASSLFVFLSIGYGISVILAGLFSGTLGYKKTIIFSLLLLGLICFSIPFVHRFWLLYAFTFAIGSLVGFYIPSAIPLITEYYSENHWGKAIAIHDTGASTAVFATPFIVLLFLRFFSWRTTFVAFGFLFLASALIFSLSCSELKLANRTKTVFHDLFTMKSLWLMAIVWMFGAGSNLGIYAIVPLYLVKELELPVAYANTILGISRLGAIGVAVSCGFLIDRFNLRLVMSLVLLLVGGFTVLMGIAPARFMGLILFLQAFCVTAFFPVGLVAIAKTFSREMRSPATGVILALSIFFGGGIIPYLLGLSGDLYSFRLGITIFGVLVALSSRAVFNLKELR